MLNRNRPDKFYVAVEYANWNEFNNSQLISASYNIYEYHGVNSNTDELIRTIIDDAKQFVLKEEQND